MTLGCYRISLLGRPYHRQQNLISVLGQSEIEVSAGWVPLLCGNIWSGLSPRCWWFAGNLWHFLASRSIKLISAFIFTSFSLDACSCVRSVWHLLPAAAAEPGLSSSCVQNELTRPTFQRQGASQKALQAPLPATTPHSSGLSTLEVSDSLEELGEIWNTELHPDSDLVGPRWAG